MGRAGERFSVVRSMLIAALSYSVVGLSVHASGEDSWSLALLARALFGLPFALFGAKALSITKEQAFDKYLMMRSVLAVSFLAFLYYSLQVIRPGDAFAFVSMRPIWVAGIYLFLRKSQVKLLFWPLSMIGVLGVILMEGSQLSGSFEFMSIALALGLLGAGSTIAIDFCKSHSEHLMTLHYTVFMLIASVILIFLQGNVVGLANWSRPRELLLFIIMGAAGNLYTLFSIKAIKNVGSEVGSSIVLLTTVFSYVAGHLIWKSNFSWLGSVGIILTLLPCLSMIGLGSLFVKPSFSPKV